MSVGVGMTADGLGGWTLRSLLTSFPPAELNAAVGVGPVS